MLEGGVDQLESSRSHCCASRRRTAHRVAHGDRRREVEHAVERAVAHEELVQPPAHPPVVAPERQSLDEARLARAQIVETTTECPARGARAACGSRCSPLRQSREDAPTCRTSAGSWYCDVAVEFLHTARFESPIGAMLRGHERARARLPRARPRERSRLRRLAPDGRPGDPPGRGLRAEPRRDSPGARVPRGQAPRVRARTWTCAGRPSSAGCGRRCSRSRTARRGATARSRARSGARRRGARGRHRERREPGAPRRPVPPRDRDGRRARRLRRRAPPEGAPARPRALRARCRLPALARAALLDDRSDPFANARRAPARGRRSGRRRSRCRRRAGRGCR